MDVRAGRWFAIARIGAMSALLLSIVTDVEARGFGGGGRGGGGFGGGIRGGGSMSISRGGGYSRGSYSRGSYSDRGYSRDRSSGTFSRDGNYSKPSALDNKPSGLDGGSRPTNWDAMTKVPTGSGTRWDSIGRSGSGSATQLPATRPGGGSATQLPASRPGSGGGSAAQLPANRPGQGGSGSQLPADRPDNGWGGKWENCPKCYDGWDGWIDHPIAAGIAIGAVAGAAYGSIYYTLPADCPPYYWHDVYYYGCYGVWYQPQYEGDTVVYVTVPDPSGGQQPQTE